ncbi:MAG TPA: hypothetical protein GXX23_00765, partial [Firmicutes bacterium]|nr:hypothetical protein [Candidatus Fermentithermobacillaceae bacterium]
MTRKPMISIRWKFMLIIAGSGIIAVVVTIILLATGLILYQVPFLGDTLEYLYRQGLAVPIIL